MLWQEIQERIAQGESDQTEFKAKLAVDRLREAVCAFANSAGGVVIVGVNDAGRVEGLRTPPDEVSEALTNLLQCGLSAPVHGRLGRHLVDDA